MNIGWILVSQILCYVVKDYSGFLDNVNLEEDFYVNWRIFVYMPPKTKIKQRKDISINTFVYN